MLVLEKKFYSISDVFILMQENDNFFRCSYVYQFKRLSMEGPIAYGELHIENRVIHFEIDSTNIIGCHSDEINCIVIDKYIFSFKTDLLY